MAINFASEEEKNGFWELSNTIQAGNYEEALNLSKNLLERFPANKAVYHNQLAVIIKTHSNERNKYEK
ncbi:hypothetical protein [uncultured Chryseobacterium sp.]|uniref:hypothetical protein n=1 Tax=uncultured Chryseobacterium sp. TaxID=259322 RepID=UPI00258A8ACE|nr:hypothetical protein [uncultured Chryseobacterium sp.]